MRVTIVFLGFFGLILSVSIFALSSRKKDTKEILKYFRKHNFKILKIKYSERLELLHAHGRSYYSKALMYYSDDIIIIVPNQSLRSILTVDPRVFLFEDRDDRKKFPHFFRPEISFSSWNALNIVLRRKDIITSTYFISINLEDKSKLHLLDNLRKWM